MYCFATKNTLFKCFSTNKSIEFFLVCNHIDDCEDQSDEKNCG